MSNNKQSMKLYTEEQVRQSLMKHQNASMLLSSEQIDYLIEEITPIELPSDEEIYLMSEKYAEKCGLKNFFNEDEVKINKHHWVMGYKSAIKDFLNTQIKGGNK